MLRLTNNDFQWSAIRAQRGQLLLATKGFSVAEFPSFMERFEAIERGLSVSDILRPVPCIQN